MSGTTLTVQGLELTRRAAGKVGQLRAVAHLRDEFGVDLLGGGRPPADAVFGLLSKPGGVRALLACLFTGPLDQLDEEDVDVSFMTTELLDFFGLSGAPSPELPGGSLPEGPSQSEAPATS